MTLLETFTSRFGDRILAQGARLGELSVRVAPTDWLAAAKYLRDECGCKQFIDIIGVHFPERAPELDVVLHVRNPETMEFIRLKTATAKDCPSLTAIWAGADWCEREAFDLFGIHFIGHPNLTRIYMPDDYPVHPMRKEIPLEGVNATYDGGFESFPQDGTQRDTTDKRQLG